MTVAPTQLSQAPERPLADRAAAGDRAALETMFAQFLPREEAVIDGDYLGKYGLWWFGTQTFAAMTHRRVAALRIRRFGHVTYEDALLEHVSTGSVRQPSRLLFYFLLAAVLVPTVGAGLALLSVVGPLSLALPALGFLLLPVVVRLHRAFVKSGLLFWVREGVPVYAYCDRGRLGRANVLFRVFGEQRDRFLPSESRPAPVEAGRSETPASGGTLLQRARAGDRGALETMFRQFLPQTDAILTTAFLGTQGLWGIGTHSFGCVTQRRAASLRVSTFGRIVFQESLSANVNGGRIHQPSRVWLYLLAAAWVLWPLSAAVGGPVAVAGLLFTIPSLPLVIRFYHGRVKSGALLLVRESPPNHLFCDRGKLRIANALYRLATERGHAGIAAATGPPPAAAVIRPGRAGVLLALALGGLLLAGGAGAAIWAMRGGDGASAGGLLGDDLTLEIGSVEIESIGSIGVVTEPVPEEQPAPALLEHVPPAIAARCSAEAPAENGVLEQLHCETANGTTLVYTQFDSAEAMEASYDIDAASVGRNTTPEGWCTNGVAGEGEWTSGDVAAGRLVCLELDGSPWFSWTEDELLILVRGFRTDGDWDAMNRTWLSAGPVP